MAQEFEALIVGARDGDERAWLVLVSELAPQITGYARSKGVADAEDLMQDVMVAVASGLGRFEGGWSDFRSWVFSIAYRRIADAHRAAYRRPAEAPLDARLSSTAPGPESLVITRTMADATLSALEVLNDTERDVIVLRVIAELDTDEVAAVIGKKPGTVRVIQSRAMKKLRKELRQWAA